MFRPQRPPPPIRLPRLAQVPTVEDLHRILMQALEARGRTVELPFNPAKQQYGYMISVFCDPEGGEPQWVLTSGDGNRITTNWTMQQSDIQLIQTVIESQCTGKEIDEVITQRMVRPDKDIDKQNIFEDRTAGAFAYTTAMTTLSGMPAMDYQVPQKGPDNATLEGDLVNMPVPNLLQSVSMSKMTGKLVINSSKAGSELFFEEGTPVHAVAAEAQGDLACLEVLTWEEGKFRFYPNERCPEKTVKKRLDSLLMEGIGLLDQTKYLTSRNVGLETYLFRKHPNLSEAEFEERVSKFVPLDMTVQKQFYQAIDNMSNIFELLRRRPMVKTEWVPILFNLLHADLVTTSDKPPSAVRMEQRPIQSLDRAMIDGQIAKLTRPETGLFTYPMLLFFLEQEFHRYQRLSVPFSLILFEMRLRDQTGIPQPMPMPLLQEALRRLGTVRRNLDIIAHFETFDFAALLPHTSTDSAVYFAHRIHELIVSTPLAPGVTLAHLSLSFGVAGIPEDAEDPGFLLAAAREAQQKASQGGLSVCLFRNINMAQIGPF